MCMRTRVDVQVHVHMYVHVPVAFFQSALYICDLDLHLVHSEAVLAGSSRPTRC